MMAEGVIGGQVVYHWGSIAPGRDIAFSECGLSERYMPGGERVVFHVLEHGDAVCMKCRWPDDLARDFELDPRLEAVGVNRLIYAPKPRLDPQK